MDLFDPGTGAQVNDLTPGTLANGLFWTTQIPNSSFSIGAAGTSARLRLSAQPLVDTFEFGGPLAIASQCDIEVEWSAIGGRELRGSGDAVAPTDPAAFLGHFAESACSAQVSGFETGFSFTTGVLDASGFYAEIGPEKNGIFL